MKIIGLTYCDGEQRLVLKSDSSLLVNRKPLFVPDKITELHALPCWVLRVSRLGRCIAPKFAQRYYDAVAPGVDFYSADLLRDAKQSGKPWTEAIAFENSLAVGAWQELSSLQAAEQTQWSVQRDGQRIEWMTASLEQWQEQMDRAVAQASELLTIRQGDLIYITAQQSELLQTEDILRCENNDKEQLYCKIK